MGHDPLHKAGKNDSMRFIMKINIRTKIRYRSGCRDNIEREHFFIIEDLRIDHDCGVLRQ